MRKAHDLVVMDWGIGGLSVYNEIRARLPHTSILYYSDSGRTPYGQMSASELRSRIRELILGFSERDIRHFVVACNAASTVLPNLRAEFSDRGLQVTGVIDHGVGLIRRSKYKNVGVIGGRRTILSRSYTRPFASRRRVVGRIAQPLSAMIERGELTGKIMREMLREILAPLRDCDALVLACTHYPAVAPLIRDLLPDCTLLDPARATAMHVRKNWKLNRGTGSKTVFMTSGSGAAMRRAAYLAFGTRISKVLEV